MTFPIADILSCFRNVTATQTQYSFTDAQILDLVNKYYVFVLPDEMKPYKTLVPWQITTLANQVTYPINQDLYYSLQPEFFINGNRILYYQDYSLWIRDFQYQYNQVQINTFNVASPLSGSYTTQTYPLVPGTVIITDGLENLVDNGSGALVSNLTGSTSSGTVNYTTGVITYSFNTAPTVDNEAVILTYAPLNNGRPRAIFYDYGAGTIQFSPIPDQAYLVQGQAYISLQNLNLAGSPLIQEWGYVLAYGAALEFFRQRGQLDQLASYQSSYDFYLDRAIGHWGQQATNQRSLAKW